MKIKNHFLNKCIVKARGKFKIDNIHVFEDNAKFEFSQNVLINSEVKNKILNLKIGLVKDTDSAPYYTKFKRFLDNNDIKYDYYNIHNSQWRENCEKFDVIIWRPMSLPWELEEAKEKIYILEKILKKRVYPTYDEILFYEDKVQQYNILKSFKFPIIDTFISYDYDECIHKINNLKYPLVSKIKSGSGSSGVVKLNNKYNALNLVNKIFRSGQPTYWTHLKQKNYVYFQEFVPNKGFDLRIICVDRNNIFGYFRNVPKNDFRASGFGVVEKKKLPIEAVKIAIEIMEKLNFTNLSVDFLQSDIDNKFKVIECSNFIRIDTDEQLVINGQPGKYILKNNKLEFEEGKYWIQEVVLKKFFENIIQ